MDDKRLCDICCTSSRYRGNYNMTRYILLCVILIPYYTFFTTMDAAGFIVPFTNWTLLATTAALLLSINASKSSLYSRHVFCGKINHEAFVLQATHHWIITISQLMNLIVAPVYWTMLHSKEMEANKNSPLICWHERLVHSLPIIVSTTNFIIS